MKCRNCGMDNYDASYICSNCGSVLKKPKSSLGIIVTVFAVILGLIGFGGGYFLTEEKEEVSNKNNDKQVMVEVPYAKTAILGISQIEISTDMVGVRKIPKSLVNDQVITQLKDILSEEDPYCVNNDVQIGEGAFFYKDQIIKCKDKKMNIYDNIYEGYKPYVVAVNVNSDNINVGDYVDIYLKTTYNDREIEDLFISEVAVITTLDSKGNILYNVDSKESYAMILVPEEIYVLLEKASSFTDIKLYAMFKGETSENPATVASEYLKSLVLSKCVTLPEEG